jgi:uncharacterized protein (DUF924 family)
VDEAILELLDFWFRPGTKVRWFDSDAELDALIRDRFGPLHDRAARGELDGLEARPGGCLALCLLLDQVPRHIFRGEPRAFATDAKARGVVHRALERGFDRRLPRDYREFLYLPLEHSEDLEDQRRAVALYEALGDPDGLDWAVRHLRVIERFGRFPHRNAVLGRPRTPEEIEFLKQPGSSF